MVFDVGKRLRDGLLTTSDAFLSHDRKYIALSKQVNFKVVEKAFLLDKI